MQHKPKANVTLKLAPSLKFYILATVNPNVAVLFKNKYFVFFLACATKNIFATLTIAPRIRFILRTYQNCTKGNVIVTMICTFFYKNQTILVEPQCYYCFFQILGSFVLILFL